MFFRYYIRMRRNLKQFLTILVLLMGTLKVYADDFTLRGKVVDEEEHALELVTVSCPAQGKVTMTNLKGEFTLHLQSADSIEVRFSMIGYAPRKRVFRSPKKQLRVQIVMHPMKALQEVTVTQQRRQTGQTQQLDVKDMKQTPSTTGNAVEELIQQQAGVSTHNELSSQYNVRGGSFDENLVYINQVEVYRPMLISSGQQEGLSIINPDMVEKIGFSTGGFEAKYGDKMSSALDITYRHVEGFEANLSASLLGASGYLGVGNKRFSMLHGLKYKTNKYLLGSMETTGEYRPNFLDYQTYISYKPNKRWTVDFIGNISDNHYDFNPEDRETSFGTLADVKSFKVYFDGQEKDLFRTFFGTIGIARQFSDSTSIKFMTSAFHSKEKETYDIMGQYWLDDAQTQDNLGVGTYMEHARDYLTSNVVSFKLVGRHQTRRHDFEAGLTYKIEHIKEDAKEYEMRDSSGYSIPHSADCTFRFATGLYYQAPFYKEMRDTVSQTDVKTGTTGVVLNDKIKSQQSLQFIAAFDYRFRLLNRPFKFTAEAYYKSISNLIPYNVQNMKVTYYGQNMGSGHAAGLDLKLYGEFVPGIDSWLTFSLMSTRQTINGQSIPMPTDQRWAVNLHFTDYFPGTDRWKMTLRLAFADGLPFGAPHRGLEGQQFRAPAYKRADIGMSFRAIKDGRGVKNLWLGVDCLNLFGISNVNSYYWVTDITNRQWAVPNYLTGRQINGKITAEF